MSHTNLENKKKLLSFATEFWVIYCTTVETGMLIMPQTKLIPASYDHPPVYFCLSVNGIIGHPKGQKLSCSIQLVTKFYFFHLFPVSYFTTSALLKSGA